MDKWHETTRWLTERDDDDDDDDNEGWDEFKDHRRQINVTRHFKKSTCDFSKTTWGP